MASRLVWLTVGFIAVAVLTGMSVASNSTRLQTAARYGRQTFTSSVGSVSPSVIGSWQAHGANDFIVENAPPDLPLPSSPILSPIDSPPVAGTSGGANVPLPAGVTVVLPNGDRIIDLVVLWRWPGQAPSFRQGAVASEPGGSANVHRITVDDRDLRVVCDPKAGTAQVVDGPLVQLNGANVLMLDVGERDVMVAGTATVDPRYTHPNDDPIEAVIARSPEVAAFVNGTR